MRRRTNGTSVLHGYPENTRTRAGAALRTTRVGVAAASVAALTASGLAFAAPATAAVGTAPAVVTSPADGNYVFVAKPTIEGYSSSRASVTVNVDGSRYCTAIADTLGFWSCDPSRLLSDLTVGVHTLEALSGSFRNTTTFSYLLPSSVPPLVVTNPTDFRLTSDAFEGTGVPGAVVRLAGYDGTEPWGETTIGADGRWSIPLPNLTVGEFRVATVTYVVGGGLVGPPESVPFQYLPEKPASEVAVVTVTAPAAGTTVEVAAPTFSGAGHPGASIVVADSAGAPLASATVAADGSWSAVSSVELPNGEATVTITQTAGADVSTATVSFTVAAAVEPPAVILPFSVTSPATDDVIGSRVPVFTGVGHPGADVEVRGNSGRVVATTTVAADGTWSATSVLTLVPGRYLATVSHTHEGAVSTAALDYHIDPAFSVVGPGYGDTVDGPRPVYTGLSEPGATVTIVGSSGRTVASTVADANGRWSAQADFDLIPGHYVGTAVESIDGAPVGTLPMDYRVQ